jgi:hypothetical protein
VSRVVSILILIEFTYFCDFFFLERPILETMEVIGAEIQEDVSEISTSATVLASCAFFLSLSIFFLYTP